MEKCLLYFGKFQTIQRNRLPKMGVFIAHDFFGDDDSAREGYRTMFDDAFVGTNYMPLYATGELRTILDTVAPNLINAESGIFDVSTHRKYNANVLIELGMALGLNYPIVVIAEDDGEPLLDFLEALKPLRYHKRRDLIDQLPDRLNEIVNTDQLLGESYCVICRQDTCSCRKRIHQQDKTYMLVGTHVEDDEVDIDVKAAVRDLKLERLIYEDGLATNLCGWLYTMRRSRFIFFYSKPLGKSHHGAENAATMVQLGMAIGSALPWGIIVPPGEFGPTDVSSILSIRADKNPKNFRSQLKNAAAFLLQEHNPFHGIYDPLEPPLEVPIEEDDRSIDDEPLTAEVRLYNVPPLSDSVFPDEKVEELIERLLQGNSSVVISGEPSIASIGKTRLAIIACHSESVQAYFSNGIYWLHLGDENPLTTACDQLYDIYDLISSKPITRIEPFDLQGLQRITGLINNITRDGSHLFVIDHIHDAIIFDVLEGLNTGQNRVLYTSRDQWIASRTPSILVTLDDPTVAKIRLDVPPLSNPPFRLERDVNAVYDLLASEQIVVIQGSAGSGKTTLATLVCQDSRIQSLFPDGIFWIRASEITSLDDVTLRAQQIAQQLVDTTGLSPSAGLAPVANRKFLIVIDGIDEIPTTPDRELRNTALSWFTNSLSSESAYKVLATSRELTSDISKVPVYTLKRNIFNGERVFIWYVHKDARELAQELYEKLAEIGLNPWLDTQSIRAGSDWRQEISNALDAAAAFIVLMTPGIHESEWFKPELQLALEQKIPILPLLVQDTELPTELKTISYIDFRTNRERELMRLIDALDRILHSKPRTELISDKQRIFIAYVRSDAQLLTQRLSNELDQVGFRSFYDFSIDVGVDWAKQIHDEIGQCDILLAIISPNAFQSQWWIRELEWAFEMNKVIVPILLEGERMPSSGSLPNTIRQLSYLNAMIFRSQQFERDFQHLVSQLQKISPRSNTDSRELVLTRHANDLIMAIQPTRSEIEDVQQEISDLRERLQHVFSGIEELRKIINEVSLFGSLSRNTAITPVSDIDALVIFRIDPQQQNPNMIYEILESGLSKVYGNKIVKRSQSKRISSFSSSILIELQRSWLEVSPAAINKDQQIVVPNQTRRRWIPTNHLLHERYTLQQNQLSNGMYTNLIRLFKWWQHNNSPTRRGYLSGFVLECLVAQAFDGRNIKGIILDEFAEIIQRIRGDLSKSRRLIYVPEIGVPKGRKNAGLTTDEFSQFVGLVEQTARLTEKASHSEDIREELLVWQQIFGDKFRTEL